VLLLLLLLRRYATDVRDRLVDFLDKTVGFKAGTVAPPLSDTHVTGIEAYMYLRCAVHVHVHVHVHVEVLTPRGGTARIPMSALLCIL
jgi:hypothetical protein